MLPPRPKDLSPAIRRLTLGIFSSLKRPMSPVKMPNTASSKQVSDTFDKRRPRLRIGTDLPELVDLHVGINQG